MKYIKHFEDIRLRAYYSTKGNIDEICKILNVKDLYFLCVNSTDKNFHWDFTKGKKYKVYVSTIGLRLKDDNNDFWCLHMLETDKMRKNIMDGKIYNFEYSGGIFTTAKSIEEYKLYNEINKYNL